MANFATDKPPESEARVCKEIGVEIDKFSLSATDDELSKKGYADLLDVFYAVCPNE